MLVIIWDERASASLAGKLEAGARRAAIAAGGEVAQPFFSPSLLDQKSSIHKYYYKPGDLIIGGNLHLQTFVPFKKPDFQTDPLRLPLGVGFDFAQGDRRVYPSFFQINPKEFPQYEGLVQLLLHFQWNWVGLMASDSEYGEHFISFLVPMLKKKEICLAFTEIFKSEEIIVTVRSFIRIFTHWFKVEVIVLFGDSNSIENVPVALNVYQEFQKTTFQKVWILTSLWKLSEMEYEETSKIVKQFHGALHLRDLTRDFLEFTHFLLTLDPFNPQGDIFLPLCPFLQKISECLMGKTDLKWEIHSSSSQTSHSTQ
ncbi:hypothetical protein E2320_022281, partial [Naja naja]